MNGWAGRDATVSFQDEKPTGQTIGAKQGKRPMRESERDTGPDETRGSCRKIDRLDEFVGAYGAVFCDVWGVVHNGVAKHPAIGIGIILQGAIDTFNWPEAATVLLAILVLVILGEVVSAFLRRRIL